MQTCRKNHIFQLASACEKHSISQNLKINKWTQSNRVSLYQERQKNNNNGINLKINQSIK